MVRRGAGLLTAGGDSASVDCVYLQPLDDGAGQLVYVNEPPASSISVAKSPSAAANDAGTGTVAWSNPTYVFAEDTSYATATLTSGQTSEWLKATGYGFSLPSTATIVGIEVAEYWNLIWSGSFSRNTTVRLVKAGTVQSTGRHGLPRRNVLRERQRRHLGGAADLWGGAGRIPISTTQGSA